MPPKSTAFVTRWFGERLLDGNLFVCKGTDLGRGSSKDIPTAYINIDTEAVTKVRRVLKHMSHLSAHTRVKTPRGLSAVRLAVVLCITYSRHELCKHLKSLSFWEVLVCIYLPTDSTQ